MAREAPAIGIDLGTTYSCVGVWTGKRWEELSSDELLDVRLSCCIIIMNQLQFFALCISPQKLDAWRSLQTTKATGQRHLMLR
jgi:molecular chaperone DnaK (HSP70)